MAWFPRPQGSLKTDTTGYKEVDLLQNGINNHICYLHSLSITLTLKELLFLSRMEERV